MSSDAFLRAQVRENKVWKPYTYGFPYNAAQVIERTILFGLYANYYLNNQIYLDDIEATALSNLLTDYNSKIADLTLREQLIVAEIVTKRYVATIDSQIHDERMRTKGAKIDSEDAAWDAKITALEVDRAVLETLQTRLAAETEKTAARIAILGAQISNESIDSQMVDYEISQRELQVLKTNLATLRAQNEVIRTQLAVVNAGIELSEVDLQVARTKIQIEGVKQDIGKTAVMEIESDIVGARTDVLGTELNALRLQADLQSKQLAQIGVDIALYRGLLSDDSVASELRVAIADAEYARQDSGRYYRKEGARADADYRRTNADISTTIEQHKAALVEKLTEFDIELLAAALVNKQSINTGRVADAVVAASAVVSSRVVHEILAE